MKPLSIVLVILALLISLSIISNIEACRVLHKEEEWMKRPNLVLQSLQKAPVRPPGSGCTGVPGGGGNPCPNTIDQMGFAGHVTVSPPHYSSTVRK